MDQIKITGGARIGRANATWPLADLAVTKDRLDVNAFLVGNLSFMREDIISIEPYSSFSRGIKINHRVKTYKEEVIFWTGKPEMVIEQIKEVGFLVKSPSVIDSAVRSEILDRQKQGGFPMRKWFPITFGVLWNAFFILDFLDFWSDREHKSPIRLEGLLALGLGLASAVAILYSKKARELILKEGRDVNDVSRTLYFIILILGFVSLIAVTHI